MNDHYKSVGKNNNTKKNSYIFISCVLDDEL